jgi:hypothetical protein
MGLKESSSVCLNMFMMALFTLPLSFAVFITIGASATTAVSATFVSSFALIVVLELVGA